MKETSLKIEERDLDEITVSVYMNNGFGERVVMVTWQWWQQTEVEEGGEEEEGDSFGSSINLCFEGVQKSRFSQSNSVVLRFFVFISSFALLHMGILLQEKSSHCPLNYCK